MFERFWGRVDVRGKDECWPWTYRSARVRIAGVLLHAPRAAWLLSGHATKERSVVNTCGTELCCNHRHLTLLRPWVKRGHRTDWPRFEEWFWSRVKRGKAEQCWPWMNGLRVKGYGWFTKRSRGRSRTWRAHRVAWMLSNLLAIPEGLYVRHGCHYPACCNPRHLSLGTALDNAQDRVKQGRRGGRPRKWGRKKK